jgi:hypothetical protein
LEVFVALRMRQRLAHALVADVKPGPAPDSRKWISQMIA